MYVHMSRNYEGLQRARFRPSKLLSCNSLGTLPPTQLSHCVHTRLPNALELLFGMPKVEKLQEKLLHSEGFRPW